MEVKKQSLAAEMKKQRQHHENDQASPHGIISTKSDNKNRRASTAPDVFCNYRCVFLKVRPHEKKKRDRSKATGEGGGEAEGGKGGEG